MVLTGDEEGGLSWVCFSVKEVCCTGSAAGVAGAGVVVADCCSRATLGVSSTISGIDSLIEVSIAEVTACWPSAFPRFPIPRVVSSSKVATARVP